MGTIYTHSYGYGIVVEPGFVTSELLRVIEFHPYYGPPSDFAALQKVAEDEYDGDLYEAWMNECGSDDYEVIEFACKKYGLNFATAGDHYSGDICYLIGDVRSDHNFWFERIGPENPLEVEATDEKLRRLMQETNIDYIIGFYSGMSIG